MASEAKGRGFDPRQPHQFQWLKGVPRPVNQLLLSNEAARLTAMLFQQLHVSDGHAPVYGFAHVVDGEQGDLYGGQGYPRTDPKTIELRLLYFWLTCPEFLGLVGQDWAKTPNLMTA